MNPARRWFPPSNTPRLVTVDNRGISSVADRDHGVSAAVGAVTAWNTNGVNPLSSTSGSVAYQLGDGRSDIIFADPLHICTGSCIAATTTGYYNTGWWGIAAPAGTSKAIVERLNGIMNKALASPDAVQRFYPVILRCERASKDERPGPSPFEGRYAATSG